MEQINHPKLSFAPGLRWNKTFPPYFEVGWVKMEVFGLCLGSTSPYCRGLQDSNSTSPFRFFPGKPTPPHPSRPVLSLSS